MPLNELLPDHSRPIISNDYNTSYYMYKIRKYQNGIQLHTSLCEIIDNITLNASMEFLKLLLMKQKYYIKIYLQKYLEVLIEMD